MNKRTNYRTLKITKCRKLQNVEKQNVENYRVLKYKTSKIQNVKNEGLCWIIYENHLFLST
jgi:hypothetical protein